MAVIFLYIDTMESVSILGRELPPIELSTSDILNRSIAIYGASASGKSFMLDHLLYLLKPHAPTMIAFNPKEISNRTFAKRLPRAAILDEPTEEAMIRIKEWQAMRLQIYRSTLNHKILASICKKARIGIPAEVTEITKIYNAVRHKHRDSEASVLEKLEELFQEKVAKAYHRHIKPAKINPKILDETEAIVLGNIGMNPNLIIAFDDCETAFKAVENSVVYRDIFNAGRHDHITSIWLLQSFNGLPAKWRRGTFINIFTQQQCIAPFFSDKANGHTKDEVAFVQAAIKHVYRSREDPIELQFWKLIYIREDPRGTKIYMIKAKPHPPFQMGSRLFRTFLERISKTDEQVLDKTNAFYNQVRSGLQQK